MNVLKEKRPISTAGVGPIFWYGCISFIKKNAVMCIAFVAAVVTSVIVPIDKEYIGYFDYKTLTCLFCVLAVVCALKNMRFFYMLARKVVQLFKMQG